MHNKIAEQLISEEQKERNVEMQIKNTQDQVKVFSDKVKE